MFSYCLRPSGQTEQGDVDLEVTRYDWGNTAGGDARATGLGERELTRYPLMPVV